MTKPPKRFDPLSTDAVIREMARVASLIEADAALDSEGRGQLLDRLANELTAYEAWTHQYASYFTEPKRWVPPAPPTLPPLSGPPALGSPAVQVPRIIVFADFGGYTGRVEYPDDHRANPGKYPSEDHLIPAVLGDFMYEWAQEFNKFAWGDAFSGEHGSMLWIPFDIRGVNIARAIKRRVTSAARVFYGKPNEDPFFRYETDREVLDTGDLVVLPAGLLWQKGLGPSDIPPVGVMQCGGPKG